MKTKFGEVIFINQDYIPNGLLLREISTGVLLERYNEQKELEEEIREIKFVHLRSEKGLRQCLAIARDYEYELDKPIYVDFESGSTTLETHNFFFEKKLVYNLENIKKEFENLISKLQQ